jgi:hypothetical protein
MNAIPGGPAPRRLRFALNAHGPRFEVYGLLCVASLRHWCGNRVEIRVYQPDNLPPCSEAARRFFERREVELVSFHNPWLPERLEDPRSVPARHLTYNKLFTLLDVEPTEQRVFIDADQVLLGDPTELLLKQEAPAALVATDTPEWFSENWDDFYQRMGLKPSSRRMNLWQTYALGKEPEPPMVETSPHICSGLVSVTADSLIPQRWLDLATELEATIETLQQSFFVDQVSLTLAAEASHQPWELLPRRCSTTPQVFRFIEAPLFFHYCGFDALSAQAARTPELHTHLRTITAELRAETGIDLRLALLTQWPRWFRRAKGLARNRLQRLGLWAARDTVRR